MEWVFFKNELFAVFFECCFCKNYPLYLYSYNCDTMKANVTYLFTTLLVCIFLVSCTNDLDVFLTIDDPVVNPIVKVDTAYRGLKPSTNGNSMDTSVDHKGQKGRDHREGIIYYNQAFKNYPDPSSLEIGKLYPVYHDHQSNQCVFMFYFGEVPIEDVIQFYSHKLLLIEFYDINNEPYCMYNQTDHVFFTGNYYYEVGDPIILPSDVCENCASFKVMMFIPQDEGRLEPTSFIQSYSAPHQWH